MEYDNLEPNPLPFDSQLFYKLIGQIGYSPFDFDILPFVTDLDPLYVTAQIEIYSACGFINSVWCEACQGTHLAFTGGHN